MDADAKLNTPAQFVRGIGPARAEVVARLGLHTARDLVYYLPREWQDLSELRTIADLTEGVFCRLRANVVEIELRDTGNGRSILGVLFKQGPNCVRGVWFQQPFLRDKFVRGQEVLIEGKPRLRGLAWEFSHPTIRWLETEEPAEQGSLLPLYRLTEGVSQKLVRTAVLAALNHAVEEVEEVLPADFRQRWDVWPIAQTLRQYHFPNDKACWELARRRLAFQELLVMQLALALQRQQVTQRPAPSLPVNGKIDARIRRLFPFELTASQKQALGEIAADLARPVPMNRLLQGDVGSGKTVVAAYAMLAAVAHGFQAVLMAPTELLARQHWQTLGRLLQHSPVRRELLAGGMETNERQHLLADLKSGAVNLVIGTQALLEPDVEFAKLGVVVIDEQHKFGVRQRAELKAAGLAPHYLVMTATPIPRTVTMTEFGDLEISTLWDLPAGRPPVHTYLANETQRSRWWDFVRRKLTSGRQAYVVTPRVETGGNLNSPGAEELHRELVSGPLRDFAVGLVHGQQSNQDKEATLAAFRRGELAVLVATSVVEVGLDVPNATLMTIEDGQQFGLAALHQLRGRISRGTHPGYCCVFVRSPTPEAQQRLDAFASTTNGFELAELDWQMRGPGQVLGTRQHGGVPLRVADLAKDEALVTAARNAAQELMQMPQGLQQPTFARLRTMVGRRYGEVLDLGDVG